MSARTTVRLSAAVLSVLGAAALCATPSHAALIGSEPFNYPDGTGIVGQTGGTGWDYNQPGTPGQWYNVDGSNPQVFNAALVTGDARNGAKRSIGQPVMGTGTVYFAATMTRGADANFSGLSWYDFGNERAFFGVPFPANSGTGTPFFGLAGDRAGGDQLTPRVAQDDVAYRIVGKVDYANHEIALWVDPAATDEASPLITHPFFENNWFTDVRLASGGPGAAGTTTWDDLAFGTDFASVVTATTPIPEPATLALPALASLPLLRRRR